MKRRVVSIAIIALAAFALSACDVVLGFVLGSDLMVENVQVLYSGEEIAGLRITFRNQGPAVENVGYVVVFSTDQTISTATDLIVYEGSVDFDRNSEKIVDLSGSNDIQPFIEQSGTEIPDDIYFLGVFIDPNDAIDEESESNNEGVSSTDFEFFGGGGGGGDAGLYPDGFEPNDSFGQYRDLPQGSWQPVNLHTPSDQDWFQVNQMTAMMQYIYIRPGPNNLNVDVMIEIYDDWDMTMTLPVYTSPFAAMNHSIVLPDYGDMRYLRVHIWSLTGQVGEYEIWSDMTAPSF